CVIESNWFRSAVQNARNLLGIPSSALPKSVSGMEVPQYCDDAWGRCRTLWQTLSKTHPETSCVLVYLLDDCAVSLQRRCGGTDPPDKPDHLAGKLLGARRT